MNNAAGMKRFRARHEASWCHREWHEVAFVPGTGRTGARADHAGAKGYHAGAKGYHAGAKGYHAKRIPHRDQFKPR